MKNPMSNNSMYMCLCSVCLSYFENTGSYKIEKDEYQETMDRCDYCNHRYGYDYILYAVAKKGK